jgi:hypothetical protein
MAGAAREPEGGSGSDLLSPEESAARATPLRSWSDAERARLAQSVSTALSKWAEAWGLSGVEAREVRCETSSAAWERVPDEDAWNPLAEATAGLWWSLSAPPSRSSGARGGNEPLGQALALLGRALFGDPAASGEKRAGEQDEDGPTIAAELVRSAWSDLATRLAGVMGAVEVVDPSRSRAGDGEPLRRLLGPWSGALSIQFSWWDRDLLLLISGDRAARHLARVTAIPARDLAAPAGGLTPLLELLGERPARVRAQLASFELELGTLVALRHSDVLRTTHPLEQPLEVKVVSDGAADGATICTGFLGKVGASRAVELTADRPPGGRDAAPAEAAGSAAKLFAEPTTIGK